MSSRMPVRDDEKLVWYFAYGSNMLAAKFTDGRGIKPRRAINVRTPGWVLSLDIPGMPYQEPTFLSLQRREDLPVRPAADAVAGTACRDSAAEPCEKALRADRDHPDAVGVAYLITADQYIQVIASEGGGIAYVDVDIAAEPLSGGETGGIRVRTLASVLRRKPWPKPSKRYLTDSLRKIVTDGAAEANLPVDYQEYLQNIAAYEPPQSGLGRAGAAIFVGFWGPIMGVMEKITHATTGKDGYCPALVIGMVRLTMILIWLAHDMLFAPLVGRGDGYGEQSSRRSDEETPLLEKQGA